MATRLLKVWEKGSSFYFALKSDVLKGKNTKGMPWHAKHVTAKLCFHVC